MRVRNVTAAGFEYQLEEWEYLDGSHLPITASWLAIGEGWHDFVGMTAFATTVELDHTWSTIELGFDSTPVVFAQVASVNDPAAATIRVRNGSGTSVQLKLEEEEAADGVHGVETVHVIAMTEGSTTMDGLGVLVGAIGRLAAPRIDHDEAPAPRAQRVEPLLHARRRHQAAVRGERVRPEHQHVIRAIDIRDWQQVFMTIECERNDMLR